MQPARLFSESFEVPEEKVSEIVKKGISTEQILETGEFEKYGEEFNIDSAMLDSMVDNFKAKVIGQDPLINFAHERREAAGWVTNVFTNPEKTKLLADIKWSEAGRAGLAGKNWRYLSAEYSESFYDGSRKKEYGPTFHGAALTNIPFLRHMPAVVGLSQESGSHTRIQLLRPEDLNKQKQENHMDPKMISLDEHQTQVRVLTTQIDNLQKELAGVRIEASKAKDLEAKVTKLEDDASKLTKEITKGKRQEEFNKLLSEGKAHAAQKDAFMSHDMDAFIKLSKPLNIKGKGHAGEDSNDDAPKSFDDLPKSEKDFYLKHLSGTVTQEVYFKSRKSTVKLVDPENEDLDDEADGEEAAN